MSLNDWKNNGWLYSHETSSQEISDLIAISDRDYADSSVMQLSADWRLNIAYNSILSIATAALAAAGFRPSRENKHYRVIHSLEHTIGIDRPTIIVLDAFRKKRHISDYDRAGLVSEQEVDELRKLSNSIRNKTIAWLCEYHKKLLG